MSQYRDALVKIVKGRGLLVLPEPVQLASGDWSREFIDGKRALADGADLELACRALLELVADTGIDFDAVGGLTLGADQFAHVSAVLAGKLWFVVRKEPKNRGTKKRIEGADLKPGVRVLLVDDVVTRGGSIIQALEEVQATGATVVCAVTLVDRGEWAAPEFKRRGIPYRPLVTYTDLEIPAVGTTSAPAAVG